MDTIDISDTGIPNNLKDIPFKNLNSYCQVIRNLDDEHQLIKRKSDDKYFTLITKRVGTDPVKFMMALLDYDNWKNSKPIQEIPMVQFVDGFRDDVNIYIIIQYNTDYYGNL